MLPNNNNIKQGFNEREFNEQRMLEVTGGYNGKFAKLTYASKPDQFSFLKKLSDDIGIIFANGIRQSWENDPNFKKEFIRLHKNIKVDGQKKFQTNLKYIYEKSKRFN